MIPRHDRHAIAVANDDVAGGDDNAAAAHGHVDLARTILVAAAGAHASAVHGEAQGGDAVHVADSAIDHETAQLRGDRRSAHELTEDRARRVAAGTHDNDVAGPCQLQRLVNHQIV